jgi:hypothetical protein
VSVPSRHLAGSSVDQRSREQLRPNVRGAEIAVQEDSNGVSAAARASSVSTKLGPDCVVGAGEGGVDLLGGLAGEAAGWPRPGSSLARRRVSGSGLGSGRIRRSPRVAECVDGSVADGGAVAGGGLDPLLPAPANRAGCGAGPGCGSSVTYMRFS